MCGVVGLIFERNRPDFGQIAGELLRTLEYRGYDSAGLATIRGKRTEIVKKQGKLKILQDFDLKTRDELLKERNDMLSGIMGDITKVITDYAKAEGYDVVLNSDPRVMLYGADGMDITATILAKLNKK